MRTCVCFSFLVWNKWNPQTSLNWVWLLIWTLKFYYVTETLGLWRNCLCIFGGAGVGHREVEEGQEPMMTAAFSLLWVSPWLFFLVPTQFAVIRQRSEECVDLVPASTYQHPPNVFWCPPDNSFVNDPNSFSFLHVHYLPPVVEAALEKHTLMECR